MSDKEFQEMLRLFRLLKVLVEKYDEAILQDFEEVEQESPIMIPPEIYTQICLEIDDDEGVFLFGIT
tara:strand:- start:814 stop:1014 length:201 start_codon:yes stop_codon:yes gene_type:complete